jgi:glycerol-1-phosphate dehydrogenase [NAD(P)+]
MTAELVFGDRILAGAVAAMPHPYALVAQPEPLEHVDERIVRGAAQVVMASSLAEEDLERTAKETPGVAAVLGLGGGTAMDTAKFLALHQGVPLLQAPSAVSVDASVTPQVAVRAGDRVEYRGHIVADRVLVDFSLIQQAPGRLNRAGGGDLLSIHTALWDWRHGAERPGAGPPGAAAAPVVPEVARRAEQILDTVTALAAEIQAVSPRGIEAIVRAYLEISETATALGHAQLEEGSEHYFVYCLEQLTGRPLIHGEAVTLGAVLMSELQRNDPARVRAFAAATGIKWRASDLGLGPDDVAATLRRLPAYVRETGLPWSVIDEAVLDEAAVTRLAEAVR